MPKVPKELSLPGLDVNAALRSILEGTATETGERFFQALVRNLAKVLNTEGAWVTEYIEESRKLRALAFWMRDQWIEDFEYLIEGTPCARVIEEACMCTFRRILSSSTPRTPTLPNLMRSATWERR